MTSPSLQKSLSLQKAQRTNSSSCVDFQSYTPKSLSQSPLWQRYREYSIKKWKQPNDGDLLSSKERILRHLVDFSQYLAEAKKEFYSKLSDHKKMDEYRMDDFHFIRTLGKGTFGRVMLAKHFYRSLESEYAIKLLDKAKIVKYKQILHVRNEIEILSAADFPFITEMLFCFMSGVYIGIGMPYFTGGDMFNYLRKKGHFEEQETQFYAAQIALVFEYLHFMGIIYRDLKPENIMFSEDGYLKLVDFGFAKKIDDGRTYTLCGTPDYLAPEVLKNKGYGKAIDWWSFGVLVYEMADGQPPFYDLRILKTYDNILRGRIQYPSHFSKSLRNFLEHLIQIDTTKRYGFLKNGIVDIKCHEWFQHFKWNELFNKTLKPFHRPNRMPDDYMIATENSESEPIRSTELSEYVDEFKDF